MTSNAKIKMSKPNLVFYRKDLAFFIFIIY